MWSKCEGEEAGGMVDLGVGKCRAMWESKEDCKGKYCDWVWETVDAEYKEYNWLKISAIIRWKGK